MGSSIPAAPWTTRHLPDRYVGPRPHPMGLLAAAPWPTSYEDFREILGNNLQRQGKHFSRSFPEIPHDYSSPTSQAWANLAILGEFWRLHTAMEQMDADRAIMRLDALPLHAQDFHVSLHLEGVDPGKVARAWWQRPHQSSMVNLPCAFPGETLGHGARQLLERPGMGHVNNVDGTLLLILERNLPLAAQIQAWFGQDYCRLWELRHAARRTVKP